MDYNDYTEALNHKLYTDFRFFNYGNNKNNSNTSKKVLTKKIEELQYYKLNLISLIFF